MLQLFFQHSDGSLEYLHNVESYDSGVTAALNDLKVRAPHFKSYYQRVWHDDNDWMWIDVGDHACFYMVKGDWQ